MDDNKKSEIIAAYQVARQAVGGFDAILITLLTQGNPFVIAILSIPFVATLNEAGTALITSLALLMSMLLFLANYIYWSLLAKSVRVSEELENALLNDFPENMRLTFALNNIKLSAGKGSKFVYLLPPLVWALAAIYTGWKSLGFATEKGIIFFLCCLLLASIFLIIVTAFLKKEA